MLTILPPLITMVASRSGQVIRLADRVTVKVARVNLDQRKIDFELTAHKPTVRSQGRKASEPARGKPAAKGKPDKNKGKRRKRRG